MSTTSLLSQLRFRLTAIRVEYAKLDEALQLLSLTNEALRAEKKKSTPQLRKPNKAISNTKRTKKRNRNTGLSSKILDIVQKNNRLTTSAIITGKVAHLYPDKDSATLGKYISVVLSQMKARKELRVITKDARGNRMRAGLWGLPTWFEGKQSKPAYLK